MNRKEFLKFSALAVAGAALGGSGFLESCSKAGSSAQGPTVDFTIDLGLPAYAALQRTGGAVYVTGVVIVRVDTSTYVAVAQTCTHQGCTIGFNTGANIFVCPCHGGTYSLNGTVLSGPPTIPIKKYTVTKTGNNLRVQG